MAPPTGDHSLKWRANFADRPDPSPKGVSVTCKHRGTVSAKGVTKVVGANRRTQAQTRKHRAAIGGNLISGLCEDALYVEKGLIDGKAQHEQLWVKQVVSKAFGRPMTTCAILGYWPACNPGPPLRNIARCNATQASNAQR